MHVHTLMLTFAYQFGHTFFWESKASASGGAGGVGGDDVRQWLQAESVENVSAKTFD